MYIFPFSLKRHHDALLAAFEATGGRLLEHPSFAIFTKWCGKHAEELRINEPSEYHVDFIRLTDLSLSDSELRMDKGLDASDPVTDAMRLAFIIKQIEAALNSGVEPTLFTPTDVMILGGRERGLACLGFRYLFLDDGEGSYAWEGFFESPDAFRLWLRSQEYLQSTAEVLSLTEAERLSYWEI